MLPFSRAVRPLASIAMATGVLLGLIGSVQAAGPVDASVAAQRSQFKAVWPLALQGGDGWRQQAQGLQSYVLFPYLETAAMQHDIRQINADQVDALASRWPNSIPVADLQHAFLRELARRQDWTSFLARYQPDGSTDLACYALQAKLAQGQSLDFERDLSGLWKQASLPDACDPVLRVAQQQGLLTPTRLWQRIDIALNAGAGGTVASLGNALPADQQASAARLAQALRDPAAATAAAASWPDTERERQAAVLAMVRLARRDSVQADQAWPSVQSHFQFSPAQLDAISYALALYAAADYQADAAQRLSALRADLQTTATRGWAVRIALANQHWPEVLSAIQALPADEQDNAEWRYFKARALQATGQTQAANAQYAKLAQETTYYGFLAADRAERNYQICPTQPLDQVGAQQQLLAGSAGLLRAMELFAVGLPRYARREWSQALAGASPETRRQAAMLAYHAGWFDRAISQFSSGPGLHYYQQRFPLDEADGVVSQAQQAGIDPAWAYAVIRAESSWTTDAHSGADAWGLMQLVPATGKTLAAQQGIAWNGTATLLDPTTNVLLGTRYLAQLAARYSGAPWQTSIAYNAGPQNMDRWLQARPGLDPDVFIATIPFYETRQYATQILTFAVLYDWRMHEQVARISQRMPAIGQSYAAAGLARVEMSCSKASPSEPAATDSADTGQAAP